MRASIVVAILLAVAGTSGPAASEPSAGAILTDLGFNLGEQVSLREGAVVARDLPRERDNELAAVAAILIPAPLARVEAVLLDDGRLRPTARIGTATAESDLPEPALSAREIQRMADAAPGSEVNLSDAEIETLRGHATADPAAAYRTILVARLEAYSGAGLAGIAPYARRSGAASSPAAELTTATRSAAAILAKHFPMFARALAKYPEGMPSDIESRFGWTSDIVDGRPALILAHDLVDRTDGYCVASHTQFYVSHTYNSLQRITVLLPSSGGTLAVAFNRTFTDRVSGPFSGFEKEVGQQMVRKSLVADLEGMRQRTVGR